MQLVDNDCLMLHVEFKVVCTKCSVFGQSLLSLGTKLFGGGSCVTK